ncbi:MAG: tetratricopeptide repeat protein [Chloroflexi bacterium]|nr:tetratricopeptide repeat protein [Chloroflexota bacterium]
MTANRLDEEKSGKPDQTLDENEHPIDIALRQAEDADQASDYLTAITAAQRAIELAQKAQNTGKEAAGYQRWGQVLFRQGNYDKAQTQLEHAVTLAQTAKDRQVEANCLDFLGRVYWDRGDYDTAKTYHRLFLRISREIGDQMGEGWAFNGLGLIFTETGDYDRAYAYLEQSLRIFRQMDEPRDEGIVLGNVGWVLHLQGDYDGARACQEQALDISRRLDDRESEGRALLNLGLLIHNLGDNETALEYDQQGLGIARDIGSLRSQGYALTNAGHALTELGRLAEAIEMYQKAVTIRQELGTHNLIMETLAGLARVSLAQSDQTQAQAYVEKILNHLIDGDLHGLEEPLRVYLTCYHVLHANQDPRAEVILNAGYRLLQQQAARIRDERVKLLFLENVTAHNEILQLVHKFAESVPVDDKGDDVADEHKTQAQLVSELVKTRRRVAELEMVAAEMKRTEETMWEGEERFLSIAKTASDAIIIFDTYEYIFFWNEAAQNIFGHEPGESRGQLLSSIVPPDVHEMLQREMERVAETGQSDLIGKMIEVTGIRRDSATDTFTEFPLELSLATWKIKEEIFFTAIGRDITDRKQAKEALQKAYEQVEGQVEERTAQLKQEVAERERVQAESLQLQQEIIEAQKHALQELSTPIIPIVKRIIVMPLIGSIDSMRARDITRSLLAGIREHQAKIVILDITGVPIVDSGVANHLNKTIQAARLKGAYTIITGISDAVAETIVDLGIDWTGIETLPDLQNGLLVALSRMGRRIAG